jgi:hypothetical protein
MVPQQTSNRTYRRGPSFVDCALVLSVIAGLAFVTMRIINMPAPPTMTQTAATDAAVARTGSAPGVTDVKTP